MFLNSIKAFFPFCLNYSNEMLIGLFGLIVFFVFVLTRTLARLWPGTADPRVEEWKQLENDSPYIWKLENDSPYIWKQIDGDRDESDSDAPTPSSSERRRSTRIAERQATHKTHNNCNCK